MTARTIALTSVLILIVALLAAFAAGPAFARDGVASSQAVTPSAEIARRMAPSAPIDVLEALARSAPDAIRLSRAVVWARYESGYSNSPRPWSRDALAGKSRCFLQVRSDRDLTVSECAAYWFARLREGERYCARKLHLADSSPESLSASLRALSTGRCDLGYRLVGEREAEADRVLALALKLIVE